MRILVVDDEQLLVKGIKFNLENEGWQVDACYDGAAAVEAIRRRPDTDLVILDVMMPGMDGIEACGEIRKLSNAPVLFLTAKSAEQDRVSAYESGGDDFLSKPFSQAELLAKISSLLRRYQQYRGKPEAELNIQGLDLDLDGRSVTSNGRTMTLTDTEYAILEHLLKNRGSVVTAAELYEAVWGEKFLSGSGNTVMVHVLNLRRKIEENPSKPKILRTVWGRGYQID